MRRLAREHYGLPVYEIDDQEYAYASTDRKADAAARAYILDSLWAFTAEFVCQFIGIYDDKVIAAVRKMQEALCEDANPLIAAMIKVVGTAPFVERAINADGRGHFLSPYDGEEVDATSLGFKTGYAYKIG